MWFRFCQRDRIIYLQWLLVTRKEVSVLFNKTRLQLYEMKQEKVDISQQVEKKIHDIDILLVFSLWCITNTMLFNLRSCPLWWVSVFNTIFCSFFCVSSWTCAKMAGRVAVEPVAPLVLLTKTNPQRSEEETGYKNILCAYVTPRMRIVQVCVFFFFSFSKFTHSHDSHKLLNESLCLGFYRSYLASEMRPKNLGGFKNGARGCELQPGGHFQQGL